MQQSQFRGSPEKIGRLGFGAIGFAGWFGEQPYAEMERSLHCALDRGVNFVDTARAYGASEAVLGRAIKSWTGAYPFLATKVEALAGQVQWGAAVPADVAFPKGQVVASCEASLRELGTDSVDLLQLHTYWPTWGISGHWADELQLLKSQRKVRYIGVSLPDHRSDLAAAKREVMPGVGHRSHKGLNNRAENSHQPIRRRERIMKRFKSPRHLQRFVFIHDPITNLFHIPRHDISAGHHRGLRSAAMSL